MLIRGPAPATNTFRTASARLAKRGAGTSLRYVWGQAGWHTGDLTATRGRSRVWSKTMDTWKTATAKPKVGERQSSGTTPPCNEHVAISLGGPRARKSGSFNGKSKTNDGDGRGEVFEPPRICTTRTRRGSGGVISWAWHRLFCT